MALRLTSPSGLLSGFCLLLPATAILSSNAVVPLLLGTTAIATYLHWRTGGRLLIIDQQIAAVLAVLLAWAAVCSLWSFDSQRAIILVVRLAVVFAAGLLLAPLLSQQTADERRHVSRWLIAGFALGLMVYFIEYAFDFPIRRLSKGIPKSEEVWPSELNRGALALALLTWPVTVAAVEWARTRWLLAFPLVMAAVVGLSESLAALAGLATGCAYAAITLLRPRLGRAVILMTLVVGIIGAPLIAQQLSAYGLQDSELVAVNTRHRIHFWSFIAEHIAEKPLLGWGFDSSRNFPNFGFDTFKANEQDVIPLHPHNAALQLWLELGAPGAMLGLLLMVIVWRRTARLPFTAHVAACGLVMTTAVGACSAYGLWQNKWMSMMIAAAALMCLYRKQNAL